MSKTKTQARQSAAEFFVVSFLVSIFFFIMPVAAQVEFTPWGNVTGIRIEGELMAFESSIRVVEPDWQQIHPTKHYWVPPSFKRIDNGYNCSTELKGLSILETVKNSGRGKARVDLQLEAKSDVVMQGAYFCIEFPEQDYAGSTLKWNEPAGNVEPLNLDAFFGESQNRITRRARGFILTNEKRTIAVDASKQTDIIILKDNTLTGDEREQQFYHIYFTILKGDAQKNQKAHTIFDIEASGEIDRDPVQLVLDAKNPGRRFDGIGGNFRLQFPEHDPQVIDYCLDNLNVSWGRIGMWWSDWHPEENKNPMEQAKAGRLKPIVYKQMEMAQRLAQYGMPVIVSVWFPPEWAALAIERRPGTYGDPLNPDKWQAAVESFTQYLLYLKNEYGVEAELFSFNEPDIGVSIAQNHHSQNAWKKFCRPWFVDKVDSCRRFKRHALLAWISQSGD